MFEKLCTTILRDYLYLLFLQHITNVNWMLVLFNLIHIFVLIIFVALLPWGVTLASCHLAEYSCFEKKSRNACSEKSHSNKVNDIFICFYLMKRQVAKISLKGLFSTKIMTLLPVCEMMTLILIKSSKHNVCQMLL